MTRRRLIVRRRLSDARAATCGARFSSTSTQRTARAAPQANRINFDKDIAPILATHCTGCHSGPKPRGGMNLTFKDENEARARLRDDDTFWERVETEVSTNQMPPAGRKPPTDAQRERLVEWIFTNVMIAATRVLRALLFETEPLDPLSLGTAALVLVGAAVVATWIPARRAMRVDPIEVLSRAVTHRPRTAPGLDSRRRQPPSTYPVSPP
jgi:hypothetical protein